MPIKALIFGTDDLYPSLKNFYDSAVHQGLFEISAYAVIENDEIKFFSDSSDVNFDIAIISSQKDFYRRMKFLESKNVPRKNIIDGRVFKIPNFDFPRLINEGIVYGVLDFLSVNDNRGTFFKSDSRTIYARVYKIKNNNSAVSLGIKSYINGGILEGFGSIQIGNFSALSWEVMFNLGQNYSHNYRNLSNFPMFQIDWQVPREFYPKEGISKIFIGNDVWIGRGSKLKCTNPDKPLKIGDGAVIASDSVVVKNVPPYAIVGGNPAKIKNTDFLKKLLKNF